MAAQETEYKSMKRHPQELLIPGNNNKIVCLTTKMIQLLFFTTDISVLLTEKSENGTWYLSPQPNGQTIQLSIAQLDQQFVAIHK